LHAMRIVRLVKSTSLQNGSRTEMAFLAYTASSGQLLTQISMNRTRCRPMGLVAAATADTLLQTFIGLISLQTGTELVSLALLFNKAVGVYGLLAIATGYSLNALQVSTYICSLLAAVALSFLLPHVRRQSPFQNLALAWLYAIDTVASAAYTSVFAVTWYQSSYDPKGPVTTSDPTTAPNADRNEQQTAQPNAGTGVQETAASLVLITFFSLVRVYFSLVVMAHARTVLQSFAESHCVCDESNGRASLPNPFAVEQPLGEGWQGKIGRVMVSIGRRYWLDRKNQDEEWTKDVSAKFRTTRA
jgi:hypothetical protein